MSLDDACQAVRLELESRGFGWQDIVPQLDQVLFAWGGCPQCFASYEFRKLLRHMLVKKAEKKAERSFAVADLSRKLNCSEAVLCDYLGVLEKQGCTEREGETWRFTADADNYGPAFESYVGQLLNLKVHWQATARVYLDDTEYNDYDVVAVRGSDILLVECKTTDPGGISDDDLKGFCARREFLAPQLSLLLVDTSSSIDHLAERLDNVLLVRYRKEHDDPSATSRGINRTQEGGDHLRWGWKNVYVADANAGAKHGILRTLQQCLRHYSRHVRGRAFWE